jgi:hypothetical protein
MATVIRGDDNFDTDKSGVILQMVPFISSTATNNTSTGWVSIAASSVAITAKQANSKFLYYFKASTEGDVSANSVNCYAQVARNGTKILSSNQTIAVGHDTYAANPAVIVTYTDSPSASVGTTLTYTVEYIKHNSGSLQINQQNTTGQPAGSSNNSHGYVMEIAV